MAWCCSTRIIPRTAASRGFMQDIWVEEAARGLGLGKRLLAAAQAVGRADWGSAYVTLGVDPGMRVPRRFMRNWGSGRGDTSS
ncbi:MAG: GNAT family N-acetyltransferase [Exiguobacterium profundum]|nr:MAG: GNAT family N-acetyltransferase [Exiguobacterium profundum]